MKTGNAFDWLKLIALFLALIPLPVALLVWAMLRIDDPLGQLAVLLAGSAVMCVVVDEMGPK